MAYAMTKQGSRDNVITYEFMCDTLADMNAIESEYRTLGSIAIVLQGESEALEVYICDSTRQWVVLNAGGSSNPETGGSGSLSIHVCAQNEVDNGLPDVAEPDENTIYLVPAGATSGNLYEEYIYVDSAWEKFGAASIDLSNYATKSEISGFYTKPSGGIPAADLAETYLTAHQDISGKANSADLATVATSGSYNDLSDKPSIPTNVSDLNNDAGYLTQHQSLDAYATNVALTALTNRVAELESEITSLRNALNLLNVPENAVRGADGTPVTDEALNYVEFDEPTT